MPKITRKRWGIEPSLTVSKRNTGLSFSNCLISDLHKKSTIKRKEALMINAFLRLPNKRRGSRLSRIF